MRVNDQALTAIQAQLGGLALEILLESDLGTFGPDGMSLELDLLLQTGRAASVQEWSNKEQIYQIGAPRYYWFQTLAHASLGDYNQAEDDLLDLSAPQVLPGISSSVHWPEHGRNASGPGLAPRGSHGGFTLLPLFTGARWGKYEGARRPQPTNRHGCRPGAAEPWRWAGPEDGGKGSARRPAAVERGQWG